jgi:hypothetical protein
MDDNVRQLAQSRGINLGAYDQLVRYLDTPPMLRDVVTIPKPSGTKERRKIERQRKRLGRQQRRRK